jgi:adenine C2-methylase RlmN of 23S rRNA A2503 and tRNA A37
MTKQHEVIKLKSKIDESVNFVESHLTGFIESRYVRRADKYFVCYLSSHDGCNRGCRFCHLTATKQTNFTPVDKDGFLEQAKIVFEHYRQENKAKFVHFSFMARGEVLANDNILENADYILLPLAEMAVKHGLTPKFNMSTIMPRTITKPLTDIFRIVTPTIYYSLYSINDEFRKTWMPAALPVEEALSILKDYQSASKKIVKIHFAFIKGQNDDLYDIIKMCDLIDDHELVCEFNLVRYNPFSSEQGCETDEETLLRNFEYIKQRFDGRGKIIQRVGYDVKASCGMFIS